MSSGGTRREHISRFPVLDKYLPVIDGWLMDDKDRPKKQRHTARRVYNRLVEEHGYEGSEPAVQRSRPLAEMALGIDTPCAFIPCDPEAGYEGEVDWGTATAILAGEEIRT